ncbi:MAG TPA: DUF2891 domain-containing protein [Salinimicrobium sp.]|nr:DUF2891 domain-containing protein [Salinimicrobium sp.]
MRKITVVVIGLLLLGCKNEERKTTETPEKRIEGLETPSVLSMDAEPIELTLEEANKLAELPLNCINVEYPNKLNQTLASGEELKEPKELHPAFYGCFDWHSSVHGHWALVNLLKSFPDLEKEEEIREVLRSSLTAENIAAEVAYFQKEHNKTYERTYGWAWLLKLAEELHTWQDPLAKELEANLQPLTSLIETQFREFLPKLNYPIRVGEHTNTAFALSFAYDYATALEKTEFRELIGERARTFYVNDDNCPLAWEPSGFDFLSPCFSEIDIMRRILPKNAFFMWMEDFMPQLKSNDFSLEVGEVSDRTDGKLVHLDGLNFSRAWVMFGLANQYPETYSHLREVAQEHMHYSFPNLVDDTYEGGHWLGTFALYALQASTKE